MKLTAEFHTLEEMRAFAEMIAYAPAVKTPESPILEELRRRTEQTAISVEDWASYPRKAPFPMPAGDRLQTPEEEAERFGPSATPEPSAPAVIRSVTPPTDPSEPLPANPPGPPPTDPSGPPPADSPESPQHTGAGYLEIPQGVTIKPVRKPRSRPRPSQAKPNEFPGECHSCESSHYDSDGWYCLTKAEQLHTESKACEAYSQITGPHDTGEVPTPTPTPTPTSMNGTTVTREQVQAALAKSHESATTPPATTPPATTPPTTTPPATTPPTTTPPATPGGMTSIDAAFDYAPPPAKANTPAELRAELKRITMTVLQKADARAKFPGIVGKYSSNGQITGIPDAQLQAALNEIAALAG